MTQVTPEDEGIYTGKYPGLQKTNKNKIENRYENFNFFKIKTQLSQLMILLTIHGRRMPFMFNSIHVDY